MSGVRVDDTGTEIIIKLINDNGLPVDISSASVMQVQLAKPNGAKVIKDAVFYTDGSDGIIKYVSTEGDFDMPGKWKIQAFITLPSGSLNSSISIFTVDANL